MFLSLPDIPIARDAYEEFICTIREHVARTHPHHKHVPPDIKRDRVPAPGLSFTRANLPWLIEEILASLLSVEEVD